MQTQTTTIDECLSSVIQAESFNHFSILQLRDAYMLNLSARIEPVEARKFVYRQILRFVRLGLLKKEEAKNVRDVKYRKTPLFHKTIFKTRSLGRSPSISSHSSKAHNEDLSQIEEQLKQYKIDLMASVGESEEYMRLYKTNPQFKVLLETEYHQARDHSSKLLGQIKALKTVLTHFSS
jgi:hypothetical protein